MFMLIGLQLQTWTMTITTGWLPIGMKLFNYLWKQSFKDNQVKQWLNVINSYFLI